MTMSTATQPSADETSGAPVRPRRVTAMFDTARSSTRALAALRASGVPEHAISRMRVHVAHPRGGDNRWGVIGGAFGSLWALLLEATLLAFPAASIFIAGGSLAAAVTGLGVGAAAGFTARDVTRRLGPGDRKRETSVVSVMSDRIAVRQRARTLMRVNGAIETRDPSDSEPLTGPALTHGFADVASELREHVLADGGSAADWSSLEPQYRYGWQVALRPDFAGRAWDSAQADLATDWERRHPRQPWRDVASRVRAGWDAALLSAHGDRRAPGDVDA